jgi:chemotaxis protein histidine kinase CheA
VRCSTREDSVTIPTPPTAIIKRTGTRIATTAIMFHNGDLTSGISKAVQENKLVVCFVRADGTNASEVWENEWLSGPSDDESTASFGDLLSTRAVVLRLNHGTQEANFLNAFCKITEPPTLVIIHNGQVLEKIEGDVTKEEFVGRIRAATKLGETTSSSVSPITSQAPAQTAAQPAQPPQRVSDTPQQQTSTSPQPPSAMQNLFPDRAQQHAAEQTRREAIEKAERSARAAARKKEADEANATSTSTTTSSKAQASARSDWLVQQKQRKDEAKREKERILAQIEADKQNRKARAQAQRNTEQPPTESSTPLPQSSSSKPSSSSILPAATHVSLQIRLFDGSSIKSRFPPTATLANDVRNWVRLSAPSTQPSEVPYTFRQILTPLPPRAIGVSEEHHSLRELDLVPSATLVLAPVNGYADAYTGVGAGEAGYLGTAWNLASRLIGSVAGLVPGLSGIVGPASSDSAHTGPSGTTAASGPSSSSSAAAPSTPLPNTSSSRNIKVKTLADQRADASAREKDLNGGGEDGRGAETEFYNGNSLGFEPRPKDDDGDRSGDARNRKGKGKERED